MAALMHWRHGVVNEGLVQDGGSLNVWGYDDGVLS